MPKPERQNEQHLTKERGVRVFRTGTRLTLDVVNHTLLRVGDERCKRVLGEGFVGRSRNSKLET
jgi:hypothetical protein